MADILVMFASKGDEPSFKKVLDALKKEKASYEFVMASAHKTPDDVDDIITKSNAKVIIAGAGLAAALPGVIAAKTIRPVIGVPCFGNYEGLDALLTIMQMPPAIPVLGVGVDKGAFAAKSAMQILKKHDILTLVGDPNEPAFKKADDLLREFGINHMHSHETSDKGINIVFTRFDEPIEKSDELVIYCPILDKKEDSAEAALNLLKHSDHGLWVGLNNGTNAAIAAIEIMNIDNEYEEKLGEYRREQATKVREYNKQ